MNKIKKLKILNAFSIKSDKKTQKFDKTIFFVYFLTFSLVVFGCLMVYSASYYTAGVRYGNEYFFLLKQLLGVVLGIFAMIFFTFFGYHILKKFR